MKKKLIAGAAGVALVSGIGLSMPQIAQADTLTPSARVQASAVLGATLTPADGRDGQGRGPGGGYGYGYGYGGIGFDAAALATKLDLPEATVSDALSAIRDQTRPATRPSRDATQAERDAARDARLSAFTTALAAELKIDEATVSTALTELQTESEAGRDARVAAALDGAVTDGTLTQAEADAVQKAVDAGIVAIRDGGSRG